MSAGQPEGILFFFLFDFVDLKVIKETNIADMHQSARCKMRCGRRERAQEVGHFNDMETTKAARATTLSMWRR